MKRSFKVTRVTKLAYIGFKVYRLKNKTKWKKQTYNNEKVTRAATSPPPPLQKGD